MKVIYLLIFVCLFSLTIISAQIIIVKPGSDTLLNATGTFLAIDGSNANQNIDIGIYNFSMGQRLDLDGGIINFSSGGGQTFMFNHGVYIRGTNGFLNVGTKLTVNEETHLRDYLEVDEYINVSNRINIIGNYPLSWLDNGGTDKYAYIIANTDEFRLSATDNNPMTLRYGALGSSIGASMDGTTGTWNFTNNVTGYDWFNGKYNWTTGDDWNDFDGSTLTFNSSKLSTTYYNATQSDAITGTIDGGTLNNTHHQDGNYDGVTFNFSEEAGSPGLELYINFTDVDSFNGGIMRYKTSPLAGDFPIIQLWSYTDLVWHDYPKVAENDDSFITIREGVFDNVEHIQDGVVQMRLYKASNGNTNNHYYIDWLAVTKGFGTPASEEVDPFFEQWLNNPIFENNINATNINLTTTGYFCMNSSACIRLSDKNNILALRPSLDASIDLGSDVPDDNMQWRNLYLSGFIRTQQLKIKSGGNITSILGNLSFADSDIDTTGSIGADKFYGNLFGNSSLNILELQTSTLTEGIIKQDGSTIFSRKVPIDQTPTFNNTFISTNSITNSLTNFAAAYLGTGNIGIGDDSLDSLSSGYYNTAIGSNTGEDIQGAYGNVLIGHRAGLNVLSGVYNTFIGRETGIYVTIGDFNTGIGINSLRGQGTSSNMQENTAIGYRTGYSISTGDENTLIGSQAGYGITTGSRNIIIGTDREPLTATTDDYINIGSLYLGDMATSTAIINGSLNVSGKVVIGSSPSANESMLIVYGNVTASNYLDFTSFDERSGEESYNSILNIRGDGSGNLEHDSLSDYVRVSIPIYENVKIGKKCWTQEIPEIDKDGLTYYVNETICRDNFEKQIVGYVDARDIGNQLNEFINSYQYSEKQNELLKSELCKKDNTYSFCK